MKTKPVILIGLLVLGAVALFIWKAPAQKKDADDAKPPTDAKAEGKTEAKTEKEAEPPSRVKRASNGEVTVTFDEATRQRASLKTANPAVTNLSAEVRGYGRALDPAPLVALVAEIANAEIVASASIPEFERLKRLSEQDNASARALQAAEAAAKRDQLAVRSARDRLLLAWGKAMAQQQDLLAFAFSFATRERVLARVDLPAGESIAASPLGARLVSLGDPDKMIAAEFFSPAPQVDPQSQGQGFLFVANGDPAWLAPGAALAGFLQLAGDPRAGVIVPREAILRHEGKTWVYVQTAPDAFTRRELTLDRPTEAGWFVTNGVTAQDAIVINGGQLLLSEELRAGELVSGVKD